MGYLFWSLFGAAIQGPVCSLLHQFSPTLIQLRIPWPNYAHIAQLEMQNVCFLRDNSTKKQNYWDNSFHNFASRVSSSRKLHWLAFMAIENQSTKLHQVSSYHLLNWLAFTSFLWNQSIYVIMPTTKNRRAPLQAQKSKEARIAIERHWDGRIEWLTLRCWNKKDVFL